jgi:chromate transport protein ChrA
MELFLGAKPIYFAVTAVINALAVAGAIRMWQMRKQGFHMYTVAQILVIIAPMYFFRLPSPDFFSILLSGVFVMLYSSNLKKMS